MIPIACDACSKSIRVKDELAGRWIKCPGCGSMMLVPKPKPASAPKPAQFVVEVVEEEEEKPRRRPRHDEEDEPPRRKRRDEEEDDERPRRKRRDEEEADEDDDRPRRRGRDGEEPPGKPSVVLLLIGLAVGFAGLLTMCLFIWLGWEAGKRVEDVEFYIGPKRTAVQVNEKLAKERGGPLPAHVVKERERLDAEEEKIESEKSSRLRNYLLAGVFGVVFLVGIGVREYHSFLVRRWRRERDIGGGRKKKRRRDEEDDDEDDD
jgi:hypothetical protein